MRTSSFTNGLSAFLASTVVLGSAALGAEDKSGTNPANFTYDFRFITEMAQLPDDAGSQTAQIFEFRWPLGRDLANLRGDEAGDPIYDMGRRWGARVRARYIDLSLENDDEALGASGVSGIGDLDARLLYIAHASSRVIVVPGMEAFFDTASNEALGADGTLLAPVIFTVFPGLVGPGSLFAPGYQYVFDVSGDDTVSRSQIDLYFVWGLAQGKNWLIVDPQVILDHENSVELGTTEVEWGFMMVPQAGISGYLRPGVGIGAYRPYDWNLEAGLKFVW